LARGGHQFQNLEFSVRERVVSARPRPDIFVG
jgi:hypothetical protein